MNGISFLAAFTSGFVSFFSPCIAPLIPAYLGYISGVSFNELAKEKGIGPYKRKILASSLTFVLGFSLTFVILGTTAASLGLILRKQTKIIQGIGGILIMIFALNLMGILKIEQFSKNRQLKLPGWADEIGYLKAFLVGIIFATAWTPCIGPVLGAILTLAALAQTALSGAVLLFAYSMGIAIPFLAISLLVAQAPSRLKNFSKSYKILNIISGLILLLIGFLLFNNSVGLISDQISYNSLNAWLFSLALKFGYKGH